MNEKKPDAERVDDDNPEITSEELRRSRPATEVLPELIGKNAARELLRRNRDWPRKVDRKADQTLRIDPDELKA